MARLSRLALPGHVHLALLPGHDGQPLWRDEEDARRFTAALRDAATQQRVAVHAYALLGNRVLLLATPESADGLSRLVQELGRRYVAGFNRRHGRSGSLWAGRYRATIVQEGAALLEAMLFVDLAAQRDGLVGQAADHPWSSVRHHVGLLRDPVVKDNPAYWSLGNTPFEREQAYRRLLEEGLAPTRWVELSGCMHKGWAIGDPAFLQKLAQAAGRPVQPRPRGRPPGAALRG
ncbi:MAG: transposase [Burkholderiales bacterium]|nr:transposase [Burkholderiales bacterium]